MRKYGDGVQVQDQGTGYVREGDPDEILYARPGGVARKVRLPV